MDSGQAKFLSTAHGAARSWVWRHLRGQSKREKVKCLALIEDYNAYMHGNDLADQMRTTNTIQIRCCKWWKPIFHWIFDSAMINAFLLFRQMQGGVADRKAFMEGVCSMFCGVPHSGRPTKDCQKLVNQALPSSSHGVRVNGLRGNISGHFLVRNLDVLNGSDKPKSTEGQCHVCVSLGRKLINLRTPWYCVGCNGFAHENCSDLYHFKSNIYIADEKVVGE